MIDLSGDISNIIFKRTFSALKEKVTMSTMMLKLLMLLDGQTTLGMASQKMHISLAEMRPFITRLIEYGVIEAIQANIETLDSRFFGFLLGQLSRITGPIAKVMVEDALSDIGSDLSDFPKNRGVELIELLGHQLPDGAGKVEFMQSMLQKLREI
jgi:hypothetical protein